MKLPRKKRDETSAAITQTLWLVLACSGLCVLTAYASDPAWWSSPGTGSRSAVVTPQVTTNTTTGVVTTNYIPNNYAVVTQGQLKQFTARAVDELNGNLPGGAGTNLNTMFSNWASDYATNGYSATNIKPSDYNAMTVGQLKYVGNKVWNQLVAAGYTNAVPSWLALNTNTDNAIANLGQLKTVFNFDFAADSDTNGLPDWWEMYYFGQLGNNPSSSPDGNGLTLLQDYQQGNDPTNYYSQGGTIITPTLTLGNGNSQPGPTSTFLPQALTVTVKDSANKPLVNAPVTFTVTGTTGGQLSTTLGGVATTSVTVPTDATGTAQVYYAGSSSANTTSSIQATAATSSVTFSETTFMNDGAVAAVTGVTQMVGGTNGQMVINWTNNATNATYLLIQQSIDDVNWVTIAKINDPTVTTYTATEADPSQSYYFAVIAGKP